MTQYRDVYGFVWEPRPHQMMEIVGGATSGPVSVGDHFDRSAVERFRGPLTKVQTAHEALAEYLQDYARLSGDEAASVARRFLDQHAHELADQIREAAKGRPPYGLCPDISTPHGAARLIDPEAS